MKLGIWILIVSVGFGPHFAERAHATQANQTSVTLDPSGTNAKTETKTETRTCTDNRTAQQGWSDNNCYNLSNTEKDDQQKDAQDKTNAMNNAGGQQASMMGMLAMAGGGAMVAAGVSCSCPGPNAGLIAAGSALIAAGMAAMMAAGKMNSNAGIADYNASRMENLIPGGVTGLNDTTPTGTTPGNTDLNGSGSSQSQIDGTKNLGKDGQPLTPGIKISDSLARNGKAGSILDKFEQETGLSREQLIDGLNAGKSAAEILGGQGKMKMTPEQLQNAIDSASAGGLMSGQEAMDKLGVSSEDLAAMGAGGDNSYGLGGGGGGGRSVASNSVGLGTGMDGFFGAGGKTDPTGPGMLGVGGNGVGLSSDIQDALDKNGITNRTIFQMVHSRYQLKVPMMFGTSEKTNRDPTNPFGNMDEGPKIKF